MKRILTVLALLIAAAGIGLVVLVLLPKAPPPPRVLPQPNGYLDFLQAGQSLTGQTPSLKNADVAALKAYLAQNQEALKKVRTGLSRECAVPWVPNETYLAAHTAELSAIKLAGYLLLTAAAIDDLEGRSAEALQGYLEAIRFAQLAGRDGLVIDRMVADSIGRTSVLRLRTLVGKLPQPERARLLRELIAWDAGDETPAAVIAREGDYFHQFMSTRDRITYGIAHYVMSFRGMKNSTQLNLDAIQRLVASRRLAIVQVALAAFEAEAKRPAARLEELCPAWLPAPPLDPFSGHPLVYKRVGDQVLLYSVGPNRTDDGGRKGTPGQTTGPADLLADTTNGS